MLNLIRDQVYKAVPAIFHLAPDKS